MKARHIAFYGKSGVGKSTIATAVSAALAEKGIRVILVGCDPRNDSTRLLRGDRDQPAVLDLLQAGRTLRIGDVAVEGFAGVLCIELGDIFQAADCAGEGMNTAFSFLRDGGLFDAFDPHVVFYDVPGEILCGGLSAPLRTSLVDKAFVVSSADIASLYTANGIFRTISRFAGAGGARLGGIIANGLTASFAESYIGDFAARTKSRVVSYVPRSLTILQSELYGKTIIETAPLSNQAYLYRRLAQQVLENDDEAIPQPLSSTELRAWSRQWGDRIVELETGLIRDGEAI